MTRRSRRSVRDDEEALRADIRRLAHDLAHPIQNIGNCCKLALQSWGDQKFRETFRVDVQREIARLTAVFGELRLAVQADRAFDGGRKGSTVTRARGQQAVTRQRKEREVQKRRRPGSAR